MASIATRGYGSFGSIAEVVARGYISVAPVVTTPVNPPGGGGRIYPYPAPPKKKRRKVIPQPLPEYEVSGPLSRDRQLEHAVVPRWDMEAWEAQLKTLRYLEEEERVKRKRKVKRATEAALLLWMLH